ncbi:MAG: ATP-binding domain-containing protein [bacterium]
MARVYPEELPESVLRNPRRSGERKTYEALGNLGSGFRVFYSVAWQARRYDTDAPQDGEADFVIAHPDLGVLVLDVKGGVIDFDAKTGKWTSTDRHGEVYELKEPPAKQARRNRYRLFRKLRDMPGWDRRWLTIGHAVGFPDVYVGDQDLRLDLPRAIVFDHDDLGRIRESVRRSFEHYSAEDGRAGELGPDRMKIVEVLLARSIHLRTPLGVELQYEDERLIELTDQQTRLLDFIDTRRRAAITGCAGSGKTMLAIEKCRRLADQGFDVLLTCYNEYLADYLRDRVGHRVDVKHFHGLCRDLTKAANVAYAGTAAASNSLLGAIDVLGPPYDAIIVDEGQDFENAWWLPLESLLRDSDEGIFYVFSDDNQNLYRTWNGVPGVLDRAPFALTENCRNTQRIHKVVASFHHDPDSIQCPGPRGRPVKSHTYRGDRHEKKMISRILHRLVVDGKVKEKEIVILTPRKQERSSLKAGSQVGQFTLTNSSSPPTNHIQVSTVHSFKGLERQVVIVAEIDRYASPRLDSVLYVGCSRARTELTLLVDTDARSSVIDRVRQITP